jgi:DNA-binding MarR family transcriptional regulator
VTATLAFWPDAALGSKSAITRGANVQGAAHADRNMAMVCESRFAEGMECLFVLGSPLANNEVSAYTCKVVHEMLPKASMGHTAMTKDLDTSLRFGFLIHDVSRLRRIVVDRSLKPLGITRSQWWVLAFLSRRDGMKQISLAGELDLSRVAIGGLLDRLEIGGFVERRADVADGRARRVYLTRAGARLVNAIREAVERVELEILSPISEMDLNQAAATLLALKEALLQKIGGEPEGADLDAEAAQHWGTAANG